MTAEDVLIDGVKEAYVKGRIGEAAMENALEDVFCDRVDNISEFSDGYGIPTTMLLPVLEGQKVYV